MDVVIGNPRVSREQLSVKFCLGSDTCQVPTQATEDSAGFDFYAAETKSNLPNNLGIVSLELRWKIPKGFYGKIFSRSGLLVKDTVTAEGVIDPDYRGIVKVLLMNHHSVKPLKIEIDDRIAQVLFMKEYDVNFEQISYPELLGETASGTKMHVSAIKQKRGEGGFGSTGKN